MFPSATSPTATIVTTGGPATVGDDEGGIAADGGCEDEGADDGDGVGVSDEATADACALEEPPPWHAERSNPAATATSGKRRPR